VNYKELSNENKIAAIAECNLWRRELDAIAPYIEALATGDSAVIEEFESFGNSPRQIAQNRYHFFLASTVYGFTNSAFNEHGWLANEAFMDCETFYFGCGIKGIFVSGNSLTIGRGPNGKWTYALDLSASRAGCGYNLSVFKSPYDSRRECLKRGLEEVIVWHTKENDKKTAPVIKEAKDMLDEIMGRKPKQLTLF
jgi:hypothetical protein